MKSKKISFKTIFMIFLCFFSLGSILLPFWAEATKITALDNTQVVYQKETANGLLAWFSDALRNQYIDAGKGKYLNMQQFAAFICAGIMILIALRLVLYIFTMLTKKPCDKVVTILSNIILYATAIEIVLVLLIEINCEIFVKDLYVPHNRQTLQHTYIYSTVGWYVLCVSGLIIGMFSKPKKKKKD